jgi:hypothetical protein
MGLLSLAGVLTAGMLAMPADGQAPAASASDTTNTPGTNAAAPEPGGFSMPSWIHFRGEIRGRFEDVSNIGWVAGTGDGYYLNRLRLSVLVKALPWLRFYAQMQDSRAANYAGSQPNTVYNPFDLRQGYVEIGREEKGGFALKIGRADITLGSGRLVSPSGWANANRSFEGIAGSYQGDLMKVDVIEVSTVLIDPTGLDEHKPGDRVFGGYFSFGKILSGARIEPYVLVHRNLAVASETGVLGNAIVPTGGFRVIGVAPFRLDYSAELAEQWGYYSTDRVSAVAGFYSVGWRVNDSSYKPHVSLQYSHASGDGSAKDGERHTFDQIYPYGTPDMFGLADQMGWKNMRNARVGFDFMATKKLKVQANFEEMYLATTQDGLYNSSGTRTILNRKATSRHVGSEPDIQAWYTWSKYLSFGGGLGRLFAGEYLTQSTKVNGYVYPFVSWTASF